MSTPLDRGSTVPLCALCIETGRATEATHQTRDGLCGCQQHIQQLEQHGRAAVRRQRRAPDRAAGPVHVIGTLAQSLVDEQNINAVGNQIAPVRV